MLTNGIDEIRIIYATDKDLRYYIMEWIIENKIISPQANNNWKVIPEKWYKEHAKKDSLLYFTGK